MLVVADDDNDPRRTTRMEGGRRRLTHELVSLVCGETSRTRQLVDEVEGSGLGLAIAREMITRVGGV
jgi:nitrogen-specific signal transduction histidine kinase